MTTRNSTGPFSRAYAHEFEREPFVVLRSVGLEISEREIRESPLWVAKRGELESLAREEDGVAADEAALVRALARRIVDRLDRAFARFTGLHWEDPLQVE